MLTVSASLQAIRQFAGDPPAQALVAFTSPLSRGSTDKQNVCNTMASLLTTIDIDGPAQFA